MNRVNDSKVNSSKVNVPTVQCLENRRFDAQTLDGRECMGLLGLMWRLKVTELGFVGEGLARRVAAARRHSDRYRSGSTMRAARGTDIVRRVTLSSSGLTGRPPAMYANVRRGPMACAGAEHASYLGGTTRPLARATRAVGTLPGLPPSPLGFVRPRARFRRRTSAMPSAIRAPASTPTLRRQRATPSRRQVRDRIDPPSVSSVLSGGLGLKATEDDAVSGV